MKGYIHSYESLAALDGEGVRFGVFMSGCPLRCVHCHNPDTQNGQGSETDAEKLVRKIKRYKPYFGENGGATFSGGEPLLQADFLSEVTELLEKEGIKYAVDTSGAVPLSEKVKTVLSGAQLVMLDIKFPDDEMYKKYTGMDMENTLKTLSFLEEEKIRVWIRTVIIPGINDTAEYMKKYAQVVKGVKCIEKYELLPFHRMGFEKYEKLGIKNPLKNTPAMDKFECEKLQEYLNLIIKEQ